MSRRRPRVPGSLELELSLGPRASGLWPLAQFGRVVTLWLAAFILLIVATVGSRSDADPENSGLWIMLGLLGGMLAGAGSTFWLIAGTRAVRSRQQAFMRRVLELEPDLEERLGVVSDAGVPSEAPTQVIGLVRLEQGTRYHRSDCQLVAGKQQLSVTAVDPTLEPCGVCAP